MTRLKSIAPSLVLVLLGMLLMLPLVSPVGAQSDRSREPIALAVGVTDNGNHILYRQWSDGLIDVRLVSPFKTPANEWPASDLAGLSYQERWKILQYGD